MSENGTKNVRKFPWCTKWLRKIPNFIILKRSSKIFWINYKFQFQKFFRHFCTKRNFYSLLESWNNCLTFLTITVQIKFVSRRRRTALSVSCPCLVFFFGFSGKSCPVSVCPVGQGQDRAVRTFAVLCRRCLVVRHILEVPGNLF